MTISQDGLTDQDMETGAQEWFSLMATVATAGIFALLLPIFFMI